MFLNQIEAFAQVAKLKSFSKAAKALFLSQPTVSAHIKALENELGVQLLIRTTKDVVLSEAGRKFYGYALDMLSVRDNAYKELQTYSTNVNGLLPIAASTIPAQYILPHIMPEVLKSYPNISIKVRQMDSEAVVQEVESLGVEFGLCGSKVFKSKCVFEPVIADPLVLATPNTEFFRNMKGSFPTSEFRNIPFIWREEGSGTGKEATIFLEEVGLNLEDLHIVAELPSTEAIKEAICCGLGVSIVSRRSVEDYEKHGDLITFDFDSESLKRNLYLVYRKNQKFSPLAESFLSCLRSYCGLS